MGKFVMVFDSMTGNTEEMATAIEKGICQVSEEVDVLLGYSTDASQIEPYEGLLIGTNTLECRGSSRRDGGVL